MILGVKKKNTGDLENINHNKFYIYMNYISSLISLTINFKKCSYLGDRKDLRGDRVQEGILSLPPKGTSQELYL